MILIIYARVRMFGDDLVAKTILDYNRIRMSSRIDPYFCDVRKIRGGAAGIHQSLTCCIETQMW